jgi:ABC-2 type transport system permease protein
MISTVIRVAWVSLSRDRVAQAMVFLLPIAFFSFFALVFGGQGRAVTRGVRVAVVDEDRSEASRALVRALSADRGLRVRTTAKPAGAPRDAAEAPLDRARAEALVREGELPVAIVIPAGFDTSFARFDGGGEPVLLLTDPSDPIAPQVAGGLLQRAAMNAAPDRMARNGIEMFDRYAGGLTPRQREASGAWLDMLRARAQADSAAEARGDALAEAAGGGSAGLVRVEERKVLGRKKDTSMISFYAAGIAVMFLLFSASAGAGTLLEEVESGTLDRVLTTRLGMTGLLAGKWIHLTLMGILAITVMFLWGSAAFGLDLAGHLPGFAVMTTFTAAAAAGFGLVLATACRTRQQLGGIATIVILMISGLGGSMFPRILMSETLQKIGLVSFNAWALDGYVKVFWREAALPELLPQLGVLAAWSVGLAMLARLLARRWETA